MEKIKIGVVGVRRGSSHMKFFNDGTRTEITAICDLDTNKLNSAQIEFGLTDSQLFQDYDAFLSSGIDVVIISTPIAFHEEQVIKALDAGKHVYSEVTMADTVSGCQNIWQAAKNAKGIYMMAENYVYFDFVRQWKKYVDEGKLGRIHYAEAEYIHNIRHLLQDEETGERYWRACRPPIHYCTHCLGPIMYLIGDDDYIVNVTGSGNRNTMVDNCWPSTIDMQVALFETKKGRGIKVCRSQVAPGAEPHTAYYSVYGTKGFIENSRYAYDGVGLRYFEGVDQAAVPIDCYQNEVTAPNWTKNCHGTGDYYMANEFLNCIEAGRTPWLNEDRAFELTVPGILAHEAAIKGNLWLSVPHFD